MPERKFFCIVNGAAGGGSCGPRAQASLAKLRAAGLHLDVYTTSGPGHATTLAREAYTDGHRHFLAVGGDGTTFEVVNGLFCSPNSNVTANADSASNSNAAGLNAASPVTLGILPLGTGNSFLRDFHVNTEEQARQALVAGQSKACDVIRVSHRDGELFYLNLLSLGLSATVGAAANRHFKRFGLAGYALALLGRLARLDHPSFPLRLDDAPESDPRPCTLLSFSNSKFTGGTMKMAPNADVADGFLDVIRVGAFTPWATLRTFPSIYRGTHVTKAGIEQTRARRVRFDEEIETDVMIDGEVLRLALRSLEVLPGALQVIA